MSRARFRSTGGAATSCDILRDTVVYTAPSFTGLRIIRYDAARLDRPTPRLVLAQEGL
jgi:hypothetical protein